MDRESQLALEEDEPAVIEFLERNRGALKPDAQVPGRYWLTMRPKSAPEERYYPVVVWTRYPGTEPSVKFADGIDGSLTTTKAWPVITGYRPGNLDICKPFTLEGFNTHPEWRNGSEAWKGTGNPFLFVVETLQDDLDNKYQGRAA